MSNRECSDLFFWKKECVQMTLFLVIDRLL
jgi:hypothetical protein